LAASRWEAWEGAGGDLHAARAQAISQADDVLPAVNARAGLHQFADDDVQLVALHVCDGHIAASDMAAIRKVPVSMRSGMARPSADAALRHH